MDRDEFEEWVEDHKDEAISNLRDADKPLHIWLAAFYESLKSFVPKKLARESVAAPDDDDDLDDDGEDDGEDEEEDE